MDAKLKDALIKDYEIRLRAYQADDLTPDEIQERDAAQAALDVLKSYEDPPAPDAPKELKDRVQMRAYFDAALHDTPLSGAELELNQELNFGTPANGGIYAPVDILFRADAVTAISAGDFGANTRPTVMTPFTQGDLGFLGITPTMVRPGETVIPVMSSAGAAASVVAKSTDADTVAATISAVKLNPEQQIRAGYNYAYVENFVWGAEFERALMLGLRGRLQEQLDNQIFSGTDTAPQIPGLYASAADPTAATGEAGIATYEAAFLGLVDGKHVGDTSQMRCLAGASTVAHMVGKYNTAGSQNAYSALRNLGVQIRQSTRIPAVASKKQDVLVALSPAAALTQYFVAVWNRFRLVKDVYTQAQKDEVYLWANVYYDAAELIDAGVKRVNFQVVA